MALITSVVCPSGRRALQIAGLGGSGSAVLSARTSLLTCRTITNGEGGSRFTVPLALLLLPLSPLLVLVVLLLLVVVLVLRLLLVLLLALLLLVLVLVLLLPPPPPPPPLPLLLLLVIASVLLLLLRVTHCFAPWSGRRHHPARAYRESPAGNGGGDGGHPGLGANGECGCRCDCCHCDCCHCDLPLRLLLLRLLSLRLLLSWRCCARACVWCWCCLLLPSYVSTQKLEPLPLTVSQTLLLQHLNCCSIAAGIHCVPNGPQICSPSWCSR